MTGMSESLRLRRLVLPHQMAMQFVGKAADDYLLSRVGIQAALWSSFDLTTQSFEKLLKAYIQFKDIQYTGNQGLLRKEVAKLSTRESHKGHDIEACLALAKLNGLVVSTASEKAIAESNTMYLRRYPGDGGATSVGTDYLDRFDEGIFEVWDNFKAIDASLYYCTGVVQSAFSLALIPGEPTRVQQHMMLTRKNRAYERRREDLESGFSNLRAIY